MSLNEIPDDSSGVPQPESHAFIVKVWIEETAMEAGRATWRGYILHVPDNQRQYLEDLDVIPLFIASYLEQFGVHIGLAWRVRRLLQRARR